jgi:hypothetical protein
VRRVQSADPHRQGDLEQADRIRRPNRGFEPESLLGHIGSRGMTTGVLRIFASGLALVCRPRAEGPCSLRSAAKFPAEGGLALRIRGERCTTKNGFAVICPKLFVINGFNDSAPLAVEAADRPLTKDEYC